MNLGLRSALRALAAVLVLACSVTSMPARARDVDINAAYARFHKFVAQGDNNAALAVLQQQIEPAVKASMGPDSKRYAGVLHEMAQVYFDLRRYAEAEDSDRRALAIAEKVLGPEHHDVGVVLMTLANAIMSQGRYRDAEELCKRGLRIFQHVAAAGGGLDDLPSALNQLAQIYDDQGRYAEVEDLEKQSLAASEKLLGAGVNTDADYAGALLNLGLLYSKENRYAEADAIGRRAEAIFERRKDAYHAAQVLTNLAINLRDQKRYAEAEALFKRSLAAFKAAHADDQAVMVILTNLAKLYLAQGRPGDAELLLKNNLTVLDKDLGANHPAVASTRLILADVYSQQKRYAEAEAVYLQVLKVLEQTDGPNHPDVAKTLYEMAVMYRASGNIPQALAFSRRASTAVIAHSGAEIASAGQQESGFAEQRADYFRLDVANLATAASNGLEPAPGLDREAFEVAQWSVQSSAANALQQMSLRFAPDAGAFGSLVRDSQDIGAVLRERNTTLVGALSGQGQNAQTLVETIRKEIADLENKLRAVSAQLEREFPDYAALANPKPIDAELIQKLLGGDEALVFFLPGDNESYVFALTRETFEWKTIALGADALTRKVAAFRRGLDVGVFDRAIQVSAEA